MATSHKQSSKVRIAMVILVAAAILATSQGVVAGSKIKRRDKLYFYTAVTASTARVQGPVKTGRQTWMCAGNRCIMYRKGAYELSNGMCASLAAQVGRLIQYGNQDYAMTPEAIATCNHYAFRRK